MLYRVKNHVNSPIASCLIPVTADIFDAECDMENGWVILG